jgi:hypothetical protein
MRFPRVSRGWAGGESSEGWFAWPCSPPPCVRQRSGPWLTPHAAWKPAVEDAGDGWGPSAVPEHLKDVPFAPFSKGDKIGRAADWTASAYQKYPGRVAWRGRAGRQRLHPGISWRLRASFRAHFHALPPLPSSGRGYNQNQGPTVAVFNFFANDEVGRAARGAGRRGS